MENQLYCSRHQEFNNDLDRKLHHLILAVEEIRKSKSVQKKDFWDKLSASATILTGLFVGLIGIFATTTYNNRALESQKAEQIQNLQVRRVEIAQKFFPHLIAKSDEEQRGALLAIASLGDEKLATDLAGHFGEVASLEVLRQLASSSDPSIARKATKALDVRAVFDSAAATVLRLTVDSEAGERIPISSGTGFVISYEGYVITAAQFLGAHNDLGKQRIAAVYDSLPTKEKRFRAHVVQIDEERDVALLRVKGGVSGALEVSFMYPDPEVGDSIMSIGFGVAVGLPRLLVRGSILSKKGPEGFWVTDLSVMRGFSGAPVFDSEGRVFGLVIGTKYDPGTGDRVGTMIRPLRQVRDVLQYAIE